MSLAEIDKKGLFFINDTLQNPFFDLIMPYLRQPLFWLPIYAFILIFLVDNFKWKGVFIAGFAIITFVITDQVSAQIIKPYVERLRPCQDFTIVSYIHLLVRCGSGFSFPSTHATNHFGFSVFLIVALSPYFRWIKIPLILWAVLVCFAQVYVGLHYPLDITFGAILGSLTGILIGYIAKRSVNLDSEFPPKKSSI